MKVLISRLLSVVKLTFKKFYDEMTFPKRMLLFVSAYIIFFVLSLLQFYAGDFIPQESGLLDSVTAYDYILPAIESASALITIIAFLGLGFVAYKKDKVKMLRFPMSFCISSVVASFLSFFVSAVLSTPYFVAETVEINLVLIQQIILILSNAVVALLLFIYFDKENPDDYSYYNDYYVENPSAYRSLRTKILSKRFNVLIILLIVVGAEILAAKLSRSALISVVITLPDEYLWVSYYIEVVADIISYGICLALAWYFARSRRITAKLIGIICLAEYGTNCFTFINNAISNIFAQSSDHWLSTFFSVIFVNASTFIISVVKLAFIIILCQKLYKKQQD